MKRIWLPLVLSFMAFSCATELVREDTPEKNYRDGGRDMARRMEQSIAEFNARSLASYSASFTIEGKSGGKSFKAVGTVLYSRDPRRMHIIFNDHVFKSNIGKLFQDGDQIGMYLPMDKRLVIDSAQGINLRNYTDLGLDYGIIAGLATGMVPLVNGYRVRQALEAVDGSETLLVVENRDTQQIIAFAGSRPVRMVLLDRRSRERIEFFLKEPSPGPESYFRKIAVIAGQAATHIQISFTTITVNKPVTVPLLKDFKVPNNVTVIRF